MPGAGIDWTALAAGRQEDGREMSVARHGDVSVAGRILDVRQPTPPIAEG
jgi:hypothetical protein